MNQKDKNLLKGLSILTGLSLLVLYLGLKIFGDPLRLVGGLVVLYAFCCAAIAAYKAFLLKPVDPKSFGQWAVVTGCTGGLGQEFAHRIAKRGMNLVLVSRSRSKLDALAEELRKTYQIEALVLVFDFAKSTTKDEEAFYDKTLPAFIAAAPVQGDVGLLVNNVGVGDEAPFAVDEISCADVADMVKVNCGAIVNMSRAILPLFKHRKGGAIINVSSGSCAQPSPYLATYASSKAFDLHFSKSCSRELAEHGVAVLGIRPYYIAGTGLYPNAKASLNAPSASKIVEGALAHLGKYEISHAYGVHGVMGYIFGTLFEDPLTGPLIARLAKVAKVNGSMIMLQTKARNRSKAKNPDMWVPVDAKAQERLHVLGLK
mmetsp:Transcript_58595/g.132643  ORF Transcript_58595/g.132643 Transcript_58595/m.132643 type:complete len:373 (+) Transcript_58595:83-1201(+)